MTSDDMGKVPALCAPNGPFLTNYTACVTCGEENAHNGNSDSGGGGGGGGWGPWGSWGPPSSTNAAADNTTSPGYLNPVFGPYLGYCNVSDVQVVYTITATSTEGGATSSIAATVVTTDITLAHDFTATSKTHPADTATPAPGPSPTSSPASGTTGTTNSGGSGGDREWIAGPIVGAILGTALIALSIAFVMYYRRRKQRRAEDSAEGPNNDFTPDNGPEVSTQENQQSSHWKHEMAAQQLEKAQLHSDSTTPRATPHELEGEGGASPKPTAEGAYAELAGQGSDHHNSGMTASSNSRSHHELAGGDHERMGVIGNRSELA
ncbi:hypothetical protein PG993_014610 [Apiospora rasikravindrae]|uniref:Uncharacterized protein n=1 Tax=Apiospora rasikravindrae TaxID=990691 RepID=A0ABR1RN78_9PEZI